MPILKRLVVLLVLFSGHFVAARPVVVFDLDHTIFDTNTRIVAMLRDLAVDFDVPELLNVTNEQVEALRQRGPDAIKFRDPAIAKLLFGRREDHSLRYSPFGARFYNDASYLIYDAVIPGAPAFVERIARELDADVYYITGRTNEIFREATETQLRRYEFPGYSPRRTIRGHTQLILKPRAAEGGTDAWKVAEFEKLTTEHHIVAVFDDASRNVNAFAAVLPPGVPVVHVTRRVGHRGHLAERIEQITNYVYNTTVTPAGESVSSVNRDQLSSIVARARCAVRLVD